LIFVHVKFTQGPTQGKPVESTFFFFFFFLF